MKKNEGRCSVKDILQFWVEWPTTLFKSRENFLETVLEKPPTFLPSQTRPSDCNGEAFGDVETPKHTRISPYEKENIA